MGIFKKTIAVFFMCLLCLAFSFRVSAIEYHGEKAESVDIPADFHIAVNDECSGHENFIQVSAREDGAFAIFAHNTNWEDTPDLVFKQHYIDIYDTDGNFVKELSYVCGFDSAIELTEDELVVYFPYNILVYDLYADTFSHYELTDGDSYANDLFFNLRQSDFQCGKWQYSCKKAIHGYTALMRTDGHQEQLLISYKGTSITVINTIVLPLAVIALVFLVRMWLRKK